MQKAAYQELTRAVPVNNKSNLGGGVTIIEPGTGGCSPMAQASKFSKTQVNWNVDQQVRRVDYGWQFGSTAKAFALVTALEQGHADQRDDLRAEGRPEHALLLPRRRLPRRRAARQKWEVRNDYTVGGNIPLQTATSQSINTAFAEPRPSSSAPARSATR